MSTQELTQPRPSRRPGLSPPVALVARVLLLAAVYIVVAELSLRLALVEQNVTPLWPPTGIAVVAFLVLGRSAWAGIALGALVVNLPISAEPWAAVTTAAGNTLAPMLAAELLSRAGFRRELDRLRDGVLIVIAALGAMVVSATVGAASLVASEAIDAAAFPRAWAVWWTGDALGVLVVAPFLLALRYADRTPLASTARRLELLVVCAAAIVGTLAVLHLDRPVLFLVVPLLGYAAWRFQQVGAAPAALFVAGLAAWSAGQGFGPFYGGTLLEQMLTLQAFNATVAFTSFFFASLVSERLRQRDALARSAADLEARVEDRTAELHRRERQLAEAEHIAGLGSWEWIVSEDRVTWSDELYRIHGHEPGAFPVTFDRAVEQVLPEDAHAIRGNLESAFARRQDHVLPDVEYRIARPDGATRVVRGNARLEVERDGTPLRLVGTVQDVTESLQAERERRIAETLQRSLLPDRLPEIPGLALQAQYVPATRDVEVGGDWYDVMVLPDGHLAVAIGDVAGHGLRAAATMGQLRMALRAYALDEPSPAAVLHRAHQLLVRLDLAEMATLIHLTFDPDSGVLRLANAGHPPPIVISGDGTTRLLEAGVAPPLGALTHPREIPEVEHRLAPGDTLLLYTDGLIERRGESLTDGIARLRAACEEADGQPSTLCDRLVATLLPTGAADDVALLALRSMPLERTLRLEVPAEPQSLAPLRHTLRRWLREMGVPEATRQDVVLACGEACSNVVQHAYGPAGGTIQLHLAATEGAVEVTVRDRGSWRPPSESDGGHGLGLMRTVMDGVEVRRGEDGTEVHLRVLLRGAP